MGRRGSERIAPGRSVVCWKEGGEAVVVVRVVVMRVGGGGRGGWGSGGCCLGWCRRGGRGKAWVREVGWPGRGRAGDDLRLCVCCAEARQRGAGLAGRVMDVAVLAVWAGGGRCWRRVGGRRVGEERGRAVLGGQSDGGGGAGGAWAGSSSCSGRLDWRVRGCAAAAWHSERPARRANQRARTALACPRA